MAKPFFITGTDTDAGKTFIACAMLEAARAKGLKTLALKPIAAGTEPEFDEPRNADALMLAEAMTEELPYQQLNPVCFEPAIAPHIAAEQAGRRVTVAQLAGYCRGALMRKVDFSLIEGAGGWHVPVNNFERMSQLAESLQTPVILVVGMRLGCLNHALLTAEAITVSKLPLAGWVANRVDPDMACYAENFATLERLIAAPCLGEVPHLADAEPKQAAEYIELSALL